MIWDDELRRVPTENRAVLGSVIGHKLTRLAHYLEDPLTDQTWWAGRGDEAHRDDHHGIALPPANACAHNAPSRVCGGARPIAICAHRAAAASSESAWPNVLRAARAHRRSVGHRDADS